MAPRLDAKFAARQHDNSRQSEQRGRDCEVAYQRLTDSIQKCEFERNGGSKISTSTLS